MKIIAFIFSVFCVITLLVACDTEIPTDESSATSTNSTVSRPESSFDEKSASDTSIHQSSEAVESSEYFESSEDVESSEEIESSAVEDSSDDGSNADIITVGDKFAPYHSILQSGTYMLKTVESKIVGGEAMPYTTTVYKKNDVTYIIIEESYGAKSEILIKGGDTYLLDSITQQAIKIDGDDTSYAETVLYTEGLRFLRQGTHKTFDTEYVLEIYTDSRNQEFSFGFSSLGSLCLYRYYDAQKKDTITITISVSPNVSEGIFDIPDGYSVVE